MAWTKAKMAIGVTAGLLLVGGTIAVTNWTLTHARDTTTDASSQAPDQPTVNLIAPAGGQSPIEPARAPQALSKRAVAAPRDPATSLIYPTAPRLSAIMAEVKAATGGTMLPSERVVQNEYGNFFQKLQLTPDQIAAFTEAIVDRRGQRVDVRVNRPFMMKSPAASADEVEAAWAEHKRQIAAELQTIDDASDARIKRLLGSDEKFEYYRVYRDQTMERSVVINAYADGLDEAGLPPLTLDQQEQLVNLLYQARVSDDPEIQAQKVPEILQQAPTLLSAEQVKVLEQYMQQVVAASVTGMKVDRFP